MHDSSGQPGYYRGFHHSEYTPALKALLMAGDDTRAKALLEPLLDAIEAEARVEQISVDPWHYRRLAILYAREGNDAAARAILHRYRQQTRPRVAVSDGR